MLRVFHGSGDASYALRDNDLLIATVGQDYFCYAASPGLHRVKVEAASRSATVEVTVAASQKVFLQQSLSSASLALTRLADAAPSPAAAAPPPPPAPPPSPAAAPPPPAPPPSRRPRPEGLAYGVDAGIGLASSRTTPATQATGSFAALGSALFGIWPSDYFLLSGRIDAALLNGEGVADLAVHVALYPGADRSGWRRDFMLFVDGGVAVPISVGAGVSNVPSVAGVARIGVGVHRWQVGPALIGPLLCGQIVRAPGEAQAAVLGGITSSLTFSSSGK